MLKKIVLTLAVLVVGILVTAAFRSPDFRVERSLAVPAAANLIFEQFNNHRNFNAFNPWAKMEPDAKISYEGPESGVGAASSWDGKIIGAGSATITESKPHELIRLRMDWKKPMEGTSTVDYLFKTEGDKTLVTWAMYGKNNFMGKLMSLFMDCESMCGSEFEKGLSEMAKIVAVIK